MKKIKHHFNFVVFFAVVIAFVFAVLNLCYAQTNTPSYTHAPEPSTILLLTSTGLFGWLVRFARRRFLEFKRFFDILVGSFGFVLSLPIIAVAAIVIKIVSPGPAFYKQERSGLDGKTFYIYKLRTMRLDAEKLTGPVWAKLDDPRIIKFGKIIRKARIDELPQFYNVLRGEMSIVGPRPERPIFVKKLSKEIRGYEKRLEVKPGITGLAQVRHKYDETLQDVKKKIKYDLLYIRKMCLLVDMRILFQTILVAALGKGAR
ncbi:MAG: UDP-phosphate N-acetylgalactosaminyl-1-phosphate transferase [Candidatus Omnitrophica bacterium CG07_land_8_20_14_0_80_42_15]|uniref:UDP-phosphate N-acetylgalactosaminyl-1-phosphate transferase n=1 Tax=Candidatus Aquitaenariimonas noxiae TaxID=1974741 RepID=A0A2J0KTV3_9BACT|nr:MAG: UDP-phosphate N-acetylgalactosaminyl-1-phosphate transferase [Candidatus Omnitrophica bacterium CG07_land_8_20_14_0_80_42_15]